MRKFVLFAIFIVLAYSAHVYFSTGYLPFLPKRELTEAEKEVKELKAEFLEVREDYIEWPKKSDLTGIEERPTPEWAISKIETIEKRLNAISSDDLSEFMKAEVGWMRMEIKKFKRRLRSDEAN